MDKKRETKISKFLSLVLRHKPEEIGITLDEAGWTDVDTLLAASAKSGFPFARAELEQVVANNDKRRFAFSDDGRRIRANQGHSVEVELGYAPVPPPDVLYHGTVDRFVETILHDGLKKMQRHHVHLSESIETASKVGERRGEAVILVIDAKRMHADGRVFYRSENNVWLVDEVPPQYVRHTGE